MDAERILQQPDDELLESLEGVLVKLNSRGWLVAAAKMEDVICEVYSALGRKMPDERLAEAERNVAGRATTLRRQ